MYVCIWHNSYLTRLTFFFSFFGYNFLVVWCFFSSINLFCSNSILILSSFWKIVSNLKIFNRCLTFPEVCDVAKFYNAKIWDIFGFF
jgi:hypothetical protein